MSDALSAIGSAAVTTVGTVAVAGMAVKAVGNATRFAKSGTKTRKSSNYHVFSGTKHKKSSGKRSKGFNVWNY